jgi:hypothetical protein
MLLHVGEYQAASQHPGWMDAASVFFSSITT